MIRRSGIAVLIVAAAAACTALGFDEPCYGGALPDTNFITGQLLAEHARDKP